MSTPTIVWFRQDLRLRDNPALTRAIQRGGAVIPVYIWAPEEEGGWPPGAAQRWWLHRSLESLDGSLQERGSRLIFARGPALETLRGLIKATGATAVCWNRRYEPAAIACEKGVEAQLSAAGIETCSSNSALLSEPWELLNKSGKPYRVYTPFRRQLLHQLKPAPLLPLPRKLRAPDRWPKSLALDALELLPTINWYATMEQTWQPGERGAQANLNRFVKDAIANYKDGREIPAVRGTSRLSPYLHFGEIGPRQLWHALQAEWRGSIFLHQLAWREFAHHLLYHFPQTVTEPLRPEFANFPWKRDAKSLRAWQRGQTGIPLVDAGMRELWATGWMHNRVRMIVGSLLVKNLLLPWQAGSRWFWDTLVDADLANNTLNWQWVAGCGADAAPYFRVFNPYTQAQRFDPQNLYIDRWVREQRAPIIDVKQTREAALDAYYTMQKKKGRML